MAKEDDSSPEGHRGNSKEKGAIPPFDDPILPRLSHCRKSQGVTYPSKKCPLLTQISNSSHLRRVETMKRTMDDDIIIAPDVL